MERLACFHLCLVIFVATVTLAGCGGAPLAPIGESIHDADLKFDTAEAFRVHADEETERKEHRGQVKQRKTLYNDVLKAYRSIVKTDPTGKYAQRSLWQMAEIYKRRYESDKAIECYEAILAVSPAGYYGDKARSAVAHIRKYRQLVQEESRKYQNYKELYAQDNLRQDHDRAAAALFSVAESYERLSNYPEAIVHYARVVDEFPDYEKAPEALTRIGNIHFYTLYDYEAGFPVFNKLIEMYPDSYEATMAIRLLKEYDRTRREIAHNKTYIDRFWNETTREYKLAERKITPSSRYSFSRTIPIVDIVVRCYQMNSMRWKDLRNYPSAIFASRNAIIAHESWTGTRWRSTVSIADSHYQIGRLCQLNGQLERAIEAYQELLDNHPDSADRGEAIYRQAVCYREIREFAKAYEGFKAYMGLGPDAEYYQEAEQIVRQFEMDQDGDGYRSYIEQDAGTSDQDPQDRPLVIATPRTGRRSRE